MPNQKAAAHDRNPADEPLEAHYPAKFLRVIDVAARYQIHQKSVWRWTKEGLLPTPVKLAPGTVRWDLRDILAWEQKAKAAK